MTDKQPEALRLANVCSNLTRYSMDAHLIAAELLRQHAENETLRAGYAAARLEIESLKAQQPGAVYAELPEPHHRGPAGTGNYFSSFTADQMRAFADATCAMRASHGQAPAQPAPQQEAQEPVAWQSRTRPTWGGNDRPWSPWEPCTKGLAEDCWKTPLLHEWAYEARALYTAPQPSPAAQGDAELGRTAMRFVDRAGDVHPGIDDAETICAEFYKAMSDVIEKMPHVQRMQPSMSAPASQEVKSHDN